MGCPSRRRTGRTGPVRGSGAGQRDPSPAGRYGGGHSRTGSPPVPHEMWCDEGGGAEPWPPVAVPRRRRPHGLSIQWARTGGGGVEANNHGRRGCAPGRVSGDGEHGTERPPGLPHPRGDQGARAHRRSRTRVRTQCRRPQPAHGQEPVDRLHLRRGHDHPLRLCDDPRRARRRGRARPRRAHGGDGPQTRPTGPGRGRPLGAAHRRPGAGPHARTQDHGP